MKWFKNKKSMNFGYNEFIQIHNIEIDNNISNNKI